LSFMVPLTMFGWIPMVVLLFGMLPPRRAVLAAFLIAWLFLPMAGYKVAMLPAYTKMTAATLGTLLGILIFDSSRLTAFRPGWIDLPILLWCGARLGASLSNDYGAYDGFSSVEYQILTWGLPWLYGRLYFSDKEGMKDLAVAIAIGGLVYVPLCLIEMKMSPRLHLWVYGFYGAQDLVQAKRFGGWRPIVFMQHGLMVGMWMCMSGLTAWWLWLTGTVKQFWRIPAPWATVAILVTAVLCRSFGAIVLLAVGMATLWIAWKSRRTWALWVVWSFVPLYIILRLSGTWSGAGMVEWSATVGDNSRAGSLQSRLTSENQFIRAVWHKPLFGFRGWYNTTEYWDKGQWAAVPDALWMIELTSGGFTALIGLALYFLWPAARTWRKFPTRAWQHSAAGPPIGLAMLITLSMIDNLFNAMLNPIFMLAAGALSGWEWKAIIMPRRVVVRSLTAIPRPRSAATVNK